MSWRVVLILFLACSAFAAEVRFSFRTLDGRDAAITINGGPAARVTLRWRFGKPSQVSLNGRKVNRLAATPDGATVDFDYNGSSRIVWK
jgi:hypothetical protein